MPQLTLIPEVQPPASAPVRWETVRVAVRQAVDVNGSVYSNADATLLFTNVVEMAYNHGFMVIWYRVSDQMDQMDCALVSESNILHVNMESVA